MPWTLAAPGLFRKTSLLCLCNFMNIYANRKCVSLSNTNLIIIYIVCSIYVYMYICIYLIFVKICKQTILRSRLIQRKLKYKLYWQSSLEIVIVLNGELPSFLRHPPPDPACPSPLLKSLFPLTFFLLHPILKYFGQFAHPHATPYCPNPTSQPSLVQTNIERMILPVQLSRSIENQALIF